VLAPYLTDREDDKPPTRTRYLRFIGVILVSCQRNLGGNRVKRTAGDIAGHGIVNG
jgi:hypothetical protein